MAGELGMQYEKKKFSVYGQHAEAQEVKRDNIKNLVRMPYWSDQTTQDIAARHRLESDIMCSECHTLLDKMSGLNVVAGREVVYTDINQNAYCNKICRKQAERKVNNA